MAKRDRNVEQAPSGRWKARYRDTDGRPRSVTFDTKAEARQFLITVRADVQRGEWTDPRLGDVTLEEWVTQWRETVCHLRPSTLARDDVYLRSYILSQFGRRKLASITQPEVAAWVAGLRARPLAPATVAKAYQILSKALTAAVHARRIAYNPCSEIKLPRIEQHEMRFLTPAHVGLLADAIDAKYRALVLLAAYGGLRIGELAALRPSSLDLLAGRVQVGEICVEVNGRLTSGPPKTRAGRRTVALPRPVVDELAAHLQAGKSEFVFTRADGGQLRVNSWRQRYWVPAVAHADLRPLRPHDLRHTAVAIWIATGANPLEVARRAGHTSVSFTLDRYGHLFPEADRTLAQRLEAVYVAPAAAPTAPVVELEKGRQTR